MKKTLKELRQLRAQKATRGKAAVSEYNTLSAIAQADLTTEQATQMAALETELQALEDEVPALDRDIGQMEATQRRNGLFAAPAQSAARTYEPDPVLTGGFKSLSHFASAVLAASTGGGIQLDAAATGYMQNAGAAGEGFLAPPSYSSDVWEMTFAEVDLFQMAAPEPISGNTTIKPKDETTPWGAAGVQAYWRSEGSAMTSSKLALTGEIMQLHELYAFVTASNEVLSDARMLENRLTKKSGQAISWAASEAVFSGNGAGKPTGIMKGPALITVNKDAGQAAATLSVNNIASMASRVLRLGGKPFWLANQDILPQLIGLVYPGTSVPAYQPVNQGLQASPWDGFLLGWPLIFSEHAETLGTTGDLVAMNLGGYYAANKEGGVDFAQSMHLYFDQALTAFRWTFRLAGQPNLSAPVSPAKGANTKSHFIALQTR